VPDEFTQLRAWPLWFTITSAVARTRSPRPKELKGLVLSGGKGSRLRPFTYTGAKQLVPIANKPILFYALEQLVECGIRDIGIVVGETGDQVRAAVGDGSRFGARVTYVNQDAPLGIAHAIKVSRPFLGDSPFVVFLGDNFIKGGVLPYVERFRRRAPDCQVLLKSVPNPRDFGVAQFENGRLARVVEKPSQPPSDLAVIGVYMFNDPVFEAVEAIRPSARGELEITDTIQYLIDHGRGVSAEVIEGPWIDTGKMDDLLAANRMILETLAPRSAGDVDAASCLEGAVVLEEGCRVEGSVIEGPAIIGERARIINSRVGPFTSVYHDSRVQGSHLEGSVVLENTVIDGLGAPVRDSLIGRNVELRGGGTRGPEGASYRLVLGDFSRIRVP
jgi:glucose-1-phosphate thymidylyltransferase